jgi:uncharacterized membrane protein
MINELFSWMQNEFGNDIVSFIICTIMLVLYHIYLHYKSRNDPTYSVAGINKIARSVWVEVMMSSGKPDVIPIQTFRNSTMAATFLASTSVLLIMGVLTLSGQSNNLDSTWHILNTYGTKHPNLWIIKLLFLLSDLFVAFFTFSMAIRIYHHVGYMINVPHTLNHKTISPQHVAMHLNRGGMYYYVGMRAYYFMVPLVFWLFGPQFMLIATVGLVGALYFTDRAPKILGNDYQPAK